MRQKNPSSLTDSDLEQVSGGRPSPSVSARGDYLPLYGNLAMNTEPDELSQVEAAGI